jgi:TRAP-type C4-dicarboxylate transport system substrate-binding protein
MSEDGDTAARRNLQSNKVNLVTPTPEDRKSAQKVMRPLWDEWASRNGAVGKELVQDSMKACGAS